MKTTSKDKATAKFYGLFQYLFNFYNKHLFKGEVKDCLIVITRKTHSFGHYSNKRWYQSKREAVDELAINPGMFHKYPLIEICQTVVHEMCHAWQYHYGKPSRNGYHNREFAQIMDNVGLVASSTGEPGGKQTGQNMADYPKKGGKFLKISEKLINSGVFKDLYFEVNPDVVNTIDENIPLFEQLVSLIGVAEGNENKPKPRTYKFKYSCQCSNVWGKPELDLLCNICGSNFKMID